MRGARVLITGAAGRIGSILASELRSDFDLTLLDRTRRDGVTRVDLRRARGLDRHFRGQDAVVHLAVGASVPASWDAVLAENVVVDVNVLEAAQRAGVGRVIFASSNHVTGLYEREDPFAGIVAGAGEGPEKDPAPLITTSDPVRPDSPYGIGKAMTEIAGRYLSETSPVSFIALRIGTVTRDGRPHEPRHFVTLLTPADLVRLVRGALDAPPDLRFGCYYGVSANSRRIWNLRDAEAELGYHPEDDAEQFR